MIVEFWFDFSCPYAYLASRRIEAIARDHGATLELCPMLLGGVFRAIGSGDGPMPTLGPAKAAHNAADMHRWAARLDAPLRVPVGHPMRTVQALRVLLGLPREVWSDAMHALYAAYWQRGEDVTRDEVIEAALVRAGVPDAAVAAARAASGTDAIKDELRRRTDQAVASGVFGAPAFVVRRGGDAAPILLWGQDRLAFLEAVLDGWDIDRTPPPGEPRRPAVPPARGQARAIDFYFDLSSPFAYLGATQIEAAARAASAPLRWRAILLGALFRDIGTPDVPLFVMPEPKRRYIGLDMNRWARWWGVPFAFPRRFPQRTIAALRLIHAADHAPALIHRLFRAMWVEGRSLEDEAELRQLAADAGVDPGLVAATQDPAIKDALRRATDEARSAGVFGTPTTIVHREGGPSVFWGQDRIELAATCAATGAPT